MDSKSELKSRGNETAIRFAALRESCQRVLEARARGGFEEGLRAFVLESRLLVGGSVASVIRFSEGNVSTTIGFSATEDGDGTQLGDRHARGEIELAPSVLERVRDERKPLRLSPSENRGPHGRPLAPLRLLVVPILRETGAAFGVLAIGAKHGVDEFDATDLELATAFVDAFRSLFELEAVRDETRDSAAELESTRSSLRDVTAQLERAEALLASSQERARSLFEVVPEAIGVVDVDTGKFAEMNERGLGIFGLTPAELTQYGPIELSPETQPDGRSSAEKGMQMIELALAGGTPRFDWIHLTKSGREVECEMSLVRLPSSTRRLVRGSLVEIAERKRAERRENNRRTVLEQLATGCKLTTILDSIVALVEQESDGALCSILLLSTSKRHLLHGAAPRLPEFYNVAVHGTEIGPTVGSCGAAAFTGKRVVVEDIETHPNWAPFKDLARRASLRSCWSEPILSSSGQVLGTFAIYHAQPRAPCARELEAISIAANLASIAIEKSRSEDALRESQALLAKAGEMAKVGGWNLELETMQLQWTEETRRIHEVPPDYVPDVENAILFYAPEARPIISNAIDEAIAHGTAWDLELPFVTRTGRRIFVHAVGEVEFKEGRARRLFGAFQDITERKRAEEERRKLETQLQQAQKLESLGLLAGGIAHDFNNLLTSILGFSDLALVELPENSPARPLVLEAIHGARRAAELTKQMLAYSGKGRFVADAVDLSKLVKDMARLLEVSISKKCVMRLSLLENPPAIEADAVQMRQIIMNLIINASEAIGDRSGTISVGTGVAHCTREDLMETYLDSNLAEGMYVFLEVADTGCGMSEETKAKIFDPFFTTKFSGRGLGLSAVLGIVRGHHGAIKVRSVSGVGTTFRVLFPATTRAAAQEDRRDVAMSGWRGSGVVLIVDDEESVRSLARRMMEEMGFSVLLAVDGQQGLDIFKKERERIRLVLLDMTMPRLDGEETLREMRRLDPAVRAVMSSGFTEQATTRSSGDVPVVFIQKPYRLDDLRTAVRRVLDESGPGDDRE